MTGNRNYVNLKWRVSGLFHYAENMKKIIGKQLPDVWSFSYFQNNLFLIKHFCPRMFWFDTYYSSYRWCVWYITWIKNSQNVLCFIRMKIRLTWYWVGGMDGTLFDWRLKEQFLLFSSCLLAHSYINRKLKLITPKYIFYLPFLACSLFSDTFVISLRLLMSRCSNKRMWIWKVR